MGLRSFDLPAEQTGSFEVSFDVTPLADKIDVFTGNASPNLGDPARCTPNMAYELVVENGKLAGTLDDTFTVVNPIRCGYGIIPLKH